MQTVDNKRSLKDEIPSIGLLIVCYSTFAALTIYASVVGLWTAVGVLVPVLVLHSSLQHEFIHGHPTRIQSFNDLLVSAPLGLFVPYLRFKDTHLAHHYDPNLTDPYDDPESNFFDPKVWNTFPKWKKWVCNFNNTLLGRMFFGPLIGLLSFYRGDLNEVVKFSRRTILSYIHHCVGLVVILAWLSEYSTLPLWALLFASYFSMSILKIRTFLEHTAHKRASARTVLIEDRGILSLLFLNNNYHSVHHSIPKLVWHKLPARFLERKDEYLRRNDSYWFRSYWSIFQLYFFKQKDTVAHPLMDGYEPEQSSEATDRKSSRVAEIRY